MLKNNNLETILSNSPNEKKSALVKRLLTPEETKVVSGGNNYAQCDSSNPGHSQSGGSYTQSGGGYTQVGTVYDMTCVN